VLAFLERAQSQQTCCTVGFGRVVREGGCAHEASARVDLKLDRGVGRGGRR
jgi:hypothetical protein